MISILGSEMLMNIRLEAVRMLKPDREEPSAVEMTHYVGSTIQFQSQSAEQSWRQ